MESPAASPAGPFPISAFYFPNFSFSPRPLGADWIIARALRTEAERLMQVDRPEQVAKLKKYLADALNKQHRDQVVQYESNTPLRDLASDRAFVEKYTYAGGYFGKMATGGQKPWKEGKTASAEAYYFEELKRDNQFILLKDASRSYSVHIQIPIAGGESRISTDGGVTWLRWNFVRKE